MRPAHWAAYMGFPRALKVLLDAGVAADSLNQNGNKPLESAKLGKKDLASRELDKKPGMDHDAVIKMLEELGGSSVVSLAKTSIKKTAVASSAATVAATGQASLRSPVTLKKEEVRGLGLVVGVKVGIIQKSKLMAFLRGKGSVDVSTLKGLNYGLLELLETMDKVGKTKGQEYKGPSLTTIIDTSGWSKDDLVVINQFEEWAKKK
jgi:hypothetical protein